MGLFGLIAEIPILGTFLKYLALQIVKNQKAFISLPNINAKRLLVPELKGFLTAEQIMEAAEQLLVNVNDRENIHQQLPIFMGRPGADNIADKFQEILK